MESYKHFSHTHNLISHQMREGEENTCSGCNSLCTDTVYACSKCNFFLHEQCFRASRSLKHPSHPYHPLTLLPYPTYPTNSFFCDSCNLSGTGFSYTCSNCEFDLHVQCAYSISKSILQQSLNLSHQTPTHQSIPYYSIPNHSLKQESMSSQISSATERISAMAPPLVTKGSAHSSQNGMNQTKTQEIMHFSHPHGLGLLDLKADDSIVCTACERNILGLGYCCTESKCNFYLHQSCFELAQEIRHKSHTEHPLTLLSSAPYNEDGFACNACFKGSTGFTYNCSVCRFDLHIKCVSLPDTMKREDHEHPLTLLYSCPIKGDEYIFNCDVCYDVVHTDCWVYYCMECDFGTHVDCVKAKASKQVESTGNPLLDAQIRLQNIQLVNQLTQQNANMVLHMAQQSTALMFNMGSGVRDSI